MEIYVEEFQKKEEFGKLTLYIYIYKIFIIVRTEFMSSQLIENHWVEEYFSTQSASQKEINID